MTRLVESSLCGIGVMEKIEERVGELTMACSFRNVKMAFHGLLRVFMGGAGWFD